MAASALAPPGRPGRADLPRSPSRAGTPKRRPAPRRARKSSLAAGYILERADIYEVIFWADAESEKALASSFSRMFRYLRGEGASEPGDHADVRDTVLADLSCSPGRWLLILDNCTDERLADNWVPRAGNGHVIVTTVNSARTPQGDTRIEVSDMLPAEAVALARGRLDVVAEPGGLSALPARRAGP
jgi:hypothetical protein